MKTAFLRRHCFIYYAALLSWSLMGCSNSPMRVENEQQQYSSTQKYLFQLIDDYKKNYYAVNDANEKGNIRAIFQDRMKEFLVDSLGRYIDSMTVTVDTVSEKDLLVTTQFYSRDIEFKYGMKFLDSMPPSGDSMYKL